MATAIKKRLARQDRHKLKKRQKEALKALLSTFERYDRARLVVPCGFGKTLVSQHTLHGLMSRAVTAKKKPRSSYRIAFIVPSLLLLEQALKSYRTHAPFKFEGLAVCGDADVAAQREKGAGEDPRLARQHLEEELQIDPGVDVTTNPEHIRNFLAGLGVRIVFSTYQSAKNLSACEFDYIVYDEAHHTAGNRDKAFAFTMDNKNVKATKRLFMTATQVEVADVSDDSMVNTMSKDDVKRYGPVAYEFGWRNAIDEGLLTPYEIVIMAVTDDEVSSEIEKNPLILKKGNIEAGVHMAACAVLTAKARKQLKLKHIISCHRYVDNALSFSSVVESYFKIPSDFISGGMPRSQRTGVLNKFMQDDRRGLISHCACLGEGVDMTCADAVVFVDSKQSPVSIAQTIGRILRLHPGKEKAYLIIPIRLEATREELSKMDETELAEVAQSKGFAQIEAVVQAMAERDSNIRGFALETGSRSQVGKDKPDTEIRKKDGNLRGDAKTADSDAKESELDSKKQQKKPRTASVVRYIGFEDHLARLEKHIHVRVVRSLGMSWQMQYEELEKYVEEHDGKYPPEEHPLYNWVQTQRRKGRGGHVMAPEREKLLEALPNWSWGKTLGLAEGPPHAFFRRMGRWPSQFEDGGWMLRENRTRARRGTLPENRRLAYETLDPNWLTAGEEAIKEARKKNIVVKIERAQQRVFQDIETHNDPPSRKELNRYRLHYHSAKTASKAPITHAEFIVAHAEFMLNLYRDDVLKKAKAALKKQESR